ncbi:hypothetical protein [Ureibacillus manganicus]|uniref:Uncharacterized protein n=1 Tax=Ureibacillus manganicus DSM 26584 TaxID=1384049 RepID=A0A0A3I1L3_9BACL|nr:hypothetical protein [Ureibacillus manganicus]KGR77360.1 hypothetical protein CD29_14920 [Ureibacillus manganicus DSM 26584]
MINEPTEKDITDMAEKLGLNKSEPLKTPLFQGDFGYTINLPVLISMLILLLAGIFLFIYWKLRRS